MIAYLHDSNKNPIETKMLQPNGLSFHNFKEEH